MTAVVPCQQDRVFIQRPKHKHMPHYNGLSPIVTSEIYNFSGLRQIQSPLIMCDPARNWHALRFYSIALNVFHMCAKIDYDSV